MSIPPILCVVGRSNSGKTRLLERLIPRLTGKGLRVAAVKHCSHIDRGTSGKDSDRLARAGAAPAIAAAADGVDLCSAGQEPLLLDLVTAFCRGSDLVLAEGYSASVHDKILLVAEDRTREAGDLEGVRLTASAEDVDVVERWVLSWFEQRKAMGKDLVGAVLVGGAGSRMGADKSAMTIGGRCVVGRLCELLADRIGRVIVVGRQIETQGVPLCAACHPDIRPALGPLGGIATALRIAAAGGQPSGVCVVACDMPSLGADMLDLLLAERDRRCAATVPVNPATGRLEPLVAIYEASCLRSVERALDSPRRSVRDWLKSAGAHLLAVPGHLAAQLENVNTPAELEAARLRRRKNRT